MLLNQNHSALLVIDVQEKLISHIDGGEDVVNNCTWLIELANEVGVPTYISEQYPKGLGPTVPPIKEAGGQGIYFDKVHFSCGADSQCMEIINQTNRQQWVLAGIETHVCMLQTAIHLRESGKDVYCVVDGTSSRSPDDKEFGLRRMEQAGIQLVTREMVFFEWLHQAGTPEFKRLSKQFLMGN